MIRHASCLLDEGRSVTEAMLESDFNTKSNFNREFSRITGESPSDRLRASVQPVSSGLDRPEHDGPVAGPLEKFHLGRPARRAHDEGTGSAPPGQRNLGRLEEVQRPGLPVFQRVPLSDLELEEIVDHARRRDVVGGREMQPRGGLRDDVARDGVGRPTTDTSRSVMDLSRFEDGERVTQLFGREEAERGGIVIELDTYAIDGTRLDLTGRFSGTLGPSENYGRDIDLSEGVAVSGSFSVSLQTLD